MKNQDRILRGFAGFLKGLQRIFNQRGTLGIQGRIFVPYYLEQGKILVLFKEYIPL